jgi:hypothetical protein
MRMPLVFMDGPWRMAMGLRAVEPGHWLWPDARRAVETAERRRLIAERRDEVIAMPAGTEAACRELLQAVIDDLATYHGEPWADGSGEPDPLGRLGGLVQEDFCLLEAGPSGPYRLVAGVLCFPLHWRLSEKLGLELRAVHGPVPHFAERLADSADRFFTSLAPERPVWRANWTLTEKPDLHQPGAREPVPGLSSDNVGERLWLRVERQTLRRLPASRVVVFGIRSLVRPLGEVAREPGVAAAMAARLREMTPEMARYKGLPPLRGALLAGLDRLAEEAARAPAAEHAAARG